MLNNNDFIARINRAARQQSHPDFIPCYFDTLHTFFRRRQAREFYTLQDLVRQLPGKWYRCRDRNGYLRGHKYVLQRPDHAMLPHLDRVAKRANGVLTRVDIAYDFPGQNVEYWRKHAVLKNRSQSALMRDVNGTTYWAASTAAKNLVVYGDRPSKVTGRKCVHVELRLMRTHIIQKQGIDRVRDLLQINPTTLFDKHVVLVEGKDILPRVLKQASKEDRSRYRNAQTSAFVDRYRASIPRRIKRVHEVLHLDRAQMLTPRDRGKKLTLICHRLIPQSVLCTYR